MIYVDNETRRRLIKAILMEHFGILSTGEDKRTVCATCGDLDTPWPCPPVRLAHVEQDRLLAL